MTHRPTAVIIGCGLAGPVSAIALARSGFDVTVHEARASPGGGAFLNLASNGLAALRALGIDRRIASEGFATPRMVMWSGSGKRLGEVPNGMTLADGTSSITVQRASLHRVLRQEAERHGIPIMDGHRAIAVETLARGAALARFDDGSEITADVVVGADGLWSRTRRAVDPDAPRPRFTRMLSIGGLASVPSVGPTPQTFHMVFGRRAFFGFSVTASREVYWFANVVRDTEPKREELASTPIETWRARLLELFDGDHGPMRAVLEASNAMTVHPVNEMPPVPRWHRGRLVLVGDAAHATSPTSGQGASMAFEDAVVLATCLGRSSTIEHALEAYVDRRRARVERVARWSKRVGSTKVLGPVGRWLRDLVMPIALSRVASAEAQRWLYDPIEEEPTTGTSARDTQARLSP